ncbi:MAG: cytidylate kinase family protein, partial [Candidatus Latescibacteria bacterium]|nr:cytidylate kinase family protein [Candidatus Latescibacterota bacterium]
MAIVTISRFLGSGGDDIALKAAESLGYDLVDTTLIVKVADYAGVSVEDAACFDERYQPRVVMWLKNVIEPRMGKILTEEGRNLNPELFIDYCRTVILGLAETGNVIIVGRGGQFILKD